MRAVVQRVTDASVSVENKIVGKINKGLVVFLGVENGDEESDCEYLARKISQLRIFEDDDFKLNLSVLDVKGQILSISQFTLFGDVRKGNRPSFTNAEKPDKANKLYIKFNDILSSYGIHVEKGIFQTDMLVHINNDGPVTILLDSKKIF